jgi:hypothetical protein
MRVLLSCSLFLFVTGIEANAQIDPGAVAQANSLVPIAGVTRLVPLAGYRVRGDGDNEGYKVRADVGNGAIAIPALMRPAICNSLQPIPDPNMHLPAPTPVERPVFGPIGESCPRRQFDLRLGITGSASPGGDDI